MANLFLLNSTLDSIDIQLFCSGIDELILVKSMKGEHDVFYKNQQVFILKNFEILCNNYSQANQVRSKFLEQIPSKEVDPFTIQELNSIFPDMCNGFLGVNFLGTIPSVSVKDVDSFLAFKQHCLSLIDFTNFNQRKDACFPHIIFCDNSVQKMIALGKSKLFDQCLDQFIALENYLKNWTKGNFSYKDLQSKTNITISPESPTTMRRYGDHRLFKTVSGKKDYFELHIKLGDLRIHLLEDNLLQKVMIGYIGKHLKI